MDRRKRIRFLEENSVSVRPLAAQGNGKTIRARTYDLSTGGARLVTGERFAVGDLLKLRIELGRTGPTISVEARVRWVNRQTGTGFFEMGVEFLRLTSRKVLVLIKHLYGQNGALPTSAPSA